MMAIQRAKGWQTGRVFSSCQKVKFEVLVKIKLLKKEGYGCNNQYQDGVVQELK